MPSIVHVEKDETGFFGEFSVTHFLLFKNKGYYNVQQEPILGSN